MRSPVFALRRTFALAFLSLVSVMLLDSSGKADIVLGQIDTFEDGTTQKWVDGKENPGPVIVPTGGPAGVNDPYLQVTSVGAGTTGKLTTFNRTQWVGNYRAAGVNEIEMDLKNLGGTTLSMRVALKNGIAKNSPGFVTTTPFLLPADGEWHHAIFLLDASSLTRVGSTTLTLDELLSNVAELRILHANAPSLLGTPVVSQVGLDNIHASAVPEPASLCLLLGGAILLGVRGAMRWERKTACRTGMNRILQALSPAKGPGRGCVFAGSKMRETRENAATPGASCRWEDVFPLTITGP